MNGHHHSTLVVLSLALLAGAAAGAGTTAVPEESPPRGTSPGMYAFRKAHLIYDIEAWKSEAKRAGGDSRPLSTRLKDLGDEVVRRRLAVPETVATWQRGQFTMSLRRLSYNSTMRRTRYEEYRVKGTGVAMAVEMALTIRKGRKAIAGEILDEILKRLAALLKERHKAYLLQVREEIVTTSAQLKADRAELAKATVVEKDLRKTRSPDDDYDETTSQIKEYRRSVRALEIELVCKQARLKAAVRKVVEIRKKAVEKAAKDPVIRQLNELVQIRQEGVKMQEALVKQGVASAASLQAVLGKLAEAKVRLIERKESVVELAGGGVLLKLNEELTVLGLDTVELEAKMQITQHMLRRFSDLRNRIRSLSEVIALVKKLNRAIVRSTGRAEYLTRRLREHTPPSLTVTGKDPKTPPDGAKTNLP